MNGLDLQTLLPSLVGAAITTAVTLQLAFLKMVISRFDKLSHAITNQGSRMIEWLKDHEEKDMSRHEENLAKFEKINISLAKIGHD